MLEEHLWPHQEYVPDPTLLKQLQIGIWDVDIPSGRCQYDEQWRAMLGLSADEVEDNQQSWEGRIHPDDLAKVQQEVMAHLAGETETYLSVHRLRHKHGHWVAVQAVGRIVQRDDHGVPQRIYGIAVDISRQAQQLRAEEALVRRIAPYPLRSTETGLLSHPVGVALSVRHSQVLEGVVAGLTSEQIAQQLQISKATVSAHRRKLMQLTHSKTPAELVCWAVNHGIGGSGGE